MLGISFQVVGVETKVNSKPVENRNFSKSLILFVQYL